MLPQHCNQTPLCVVYWWTSVQANNVHCVCMYCTSLIYWTAPTYPISRSSALKSLSILKYTSVLSVSVGWNELCPNSCTLISWSYGLCDNYLLCNNYGTCVGYTQCSNRNWLNYRIVCIFRDHERKLLWIKTKLLCTIIYMCIGLICWAILRTKFNTWHSVAWL